MHPKGTKEDPRNATLTPKDDSNLMVVLSAAHSGFGKRVLPFLASAVACGGAYWYSIQKQGSPPPLLEFTVIVMFTTVVLVRLLRRELWSMMDTVEYSGDAIALKRWKKSEIVSLTAVKSVRWEPYFVGFIVTLELSRRTEFGSEVRFFAPDVRKAPDIVRELEALPARVQSTSHD